MKLNKLKIGLYRNLLPAEVFFDDGINVIWGDNAQGKTNLLEGIYIFARGKPYRIKKESDVIPFGKDSASLEIEYTSFNRDNSMSVFYRKGEKRQMKICGGEITKASEFIGNFKAVLFCPDHLSIIKDSPSQRRLFLDVAISQTDKKYVYMLKKYNKLLLQRAAFIKDCAEKNTVNFNMLEALSQQLSPCASYIEKKRKAYCKKLEGYMGISIDEMSCGKEKVIVSYCGITEKDEEPSTEAFEKVYTDNIKKEIQYKMNLYGPHRDDVDILLNGRSSRFYCSQGQQRSLSLAAKLAEGEISNDEMGEYPVYLFDDVLSELDSGRASYLLSKLDNKQVIITSCNEELFSPYGVNNRINVKAGEIKCTFSPPDTKY